MGATSVPPLSEGGCLWRRITLTGYTAPRSGQKPNRTVYGAVAVGVTPREAVPLASTERSRSVFMPSPTDPIQKRVLLWLSSIDQNGRGYELRGVRGWALNKEIATALNRRLTDELARLAERKLIDRENIALHGRTQGMWLYRINERGADLIGAAAPSPPGLPWDAEKPHLIFTAPQWAALEYMRAARTKATPARFDTREIGWRTIKEIREGASSRRKEIDVWPDDVYFLERSRLVEKRQAPGISRERPLAFYRITEIGDSVERLQWH